MKKRKSKAIVEKQAVGLGEAETPATDHAGEMASTPADDGPKHEPLPEATIEANLGGRFLMVGSDGKQWEGTIRGRSSSKEGHWDAFDHLESLRIVSTDEVIDVVAARLDNGLAEQAGAANRGDNNLLVDPNVAAIDPSVAARPDDSLAEQAGAANQGDNNPLVDSDVAAIDPCHEPNPTDPEKVRAEPLAEPGASEDAAATPSERVASNAKNRKKGHDDPFSWRKRVPKKLHDLGDKCILADVRTASTEKSFVEAYYDEGDLLTLFKKALKNVGIKREFVKLCNDRMGIDPTRRKRAMRAYNYLSARGGRAACENYETLTGLLREIAEAANDNDEAGPGELSTVARKGGRREPKGTVGDDDEGAGGDTPAEDSGGKGAAVETPAEDSGGEGAAIDTTDEAAGRETSAEDSGGEGVAVEDSGETPAEDSGAEGAAIDTTAEAAGRETPAEDLGDDHRAVDTPAEDSGGKGAAVEDSGETPTEDSGGEGAAVDVDTDVQRPVNDSERKLCRNYINGIGNLARAEFVLMQVKVDDSQA